MHPSNSALAFAIWFAVSLAVAGCASTPSHTPPMPTPQQRDGIEVEVPDIARPDGESAQWWFRNGAAQAAARGAMTGRAKNVILFVGDGMSLITVAAARILEGQRKGGPGEENRLSWEDFPDTALSRTYNTNSQTPDSAGTASAMATGVKTRLGVLGIGQQAVRGDCVQAKAARLLTLWELAAASGLATGVVTTTPVTDATPASTYSHSAERNWENDSDMPDATKAAGCADSARQLIETQPAHGLDVVMGGGRKNFMPTSAPDPEYPDQAGERRDGRNLIVEWQQRHPGGSYVWNAAQLAAAPVETPLLALFEPDVMHYAHDRTDDGAGEPSLAEMTRAAIARLSLNTNGFVLMVEGGRIDHAHHAGNAFRALDETIALSDAVRVATEMTSAEDTLILVTADHSHTLTFAGYPRRGNPILGKVHGGSRESTATIDPTALAHDATGLPYTTLGYYSGPGYAGATDQQPEGPKFLRKRPATIQASTGGRHDLTNVDTENPDYLQEALIPMRSEIHGGDDVGIWARGPGSSAVRGSVEQNTIFHFLLQATPRLRDALCTKGDCDANGVPVLLPKPASF
ncbi:alkaline phosphatase [Thermomonas sp.]|uniref:alkaline phosphatase n=1 Tax=Thermomonas sp. TaxID=1971895 RepID=UPI0024873781|nr:alkaline phosphatase [Thermomonas sp.]MDI1253922.1 alkaline phosphatase [Thermomonas sp.]